MNGTGKLTDAGRMTLRELVGLRIVRARKRRGWSQEALAGRLGVSQRMLRRWERGIFAPSLEALVKLAEVLGSATDELLRGTPAPAPQAQIPPEQNSEAAKYLNGFLRAIGWPLPAKGKAKREE